MDYKETGATASDRSPQGVNYQRQADSKPADSAPQEKPLNPQSKRAAVLRVFLERGSAGLNCFEAVRLAHDYVLRTTVSECQRYHGIAFAKTYEQIPGHNDSKVDCVRYVLTPEGAARVRKLLEGGTPEAPKPDRAKQTQADKEGWERALKAEEQARRERAERLAV
jgi:hypothetical protein